MAVKHHEAAAHTHTHTHCCFFISGRENKARNKKGLLVHATLQVQQEQQ